MPVMVVLPAIAGFVAGAAAFSGAMVGIGIAAGSLMTATLVGAVAGAVVGGLGAAITGGDIMDGVLYGAVGGAVGGFLGGMYGPALFGTKASSINIGAGEGLGSSGIETSMGSQVTGIENSIFSNGPGGTIGSGAGVTAGSTGMSDMMQYSLISGGAEMLKGNPEVPYSNTEAGTNAAIAAAKEKSAAEIAASERIAKINSETSLANQQLSATTTREGYASQERQAAEAIAQRKLELQTPIEQANLARDRARETASGLTLARKKAQESTDPNNMV